MSGINLRPKFFSATTNVLILLCIMYALTYINQNNVSTAAFVFKQNLHLTNTQVGLVFSAFAYPYLIFQIIGGWVSDRFGARMALTASAVIWGSATLLTGKANGLAALVCARLLLGFGEGATFPTATRAMSDWLPQKKTRVRAGNYPCLRQIRQRSYAPHSGVVNCVRNVARVFYHSRTYQCGLGNCLGAVLPE